MIQTTIRMPEKLYQHFKGEAKERGVSVNSLMITALYEAGMCRDRADKPFKQMLEK